MNVQNKFGRTPLWDTVWYNRENMCRVVELLIKNGADVNIKDNDGVTALFKATSTHNNAQVVKILTKAGADVRMNQRDMQRKQELELLQKAGRVDPHYNMGTVKNYSVYFFRKDKLEIDPKTKAVIPRYGATSFGKYGIEAKNGDEAKAAIEFQLNNDSNPSTSILRQVMNDGGAYFVYRQYQLKGENIRKEASENLWKDLCNYDVF